MKIRKEMLVHPVYNIEWYSVTDYIKCRCKQCGEYLFGISLVADELEVNCSSPPELEV